MTKNRILLIGLGHHAKRIHVPVINALDNAALVGVIDVTERKIEVETYLKQFPKNIQTFFVNKDAMNVSELTKFSKLINAQSVIISTDPEYHTIYAKWALNTGLSVLMDKPVHAEIGSAHNMIAAKKIHEEYEELLAAYEKNISKYPNISCEILSQRRFHPAYRTIKKIVDEIYEQTSCPITYYYAFHNDGQWRLPSEIKEIEYHGFNKGFGKASHSGYHFYDLLNWYTENFRSDKSINNIEVKSWPNFPSDFLTQIDSSVYKKVFNKNFTTDKQQLGTYGEIDVMSTIRLRADEATITHAQVDLLHSGLSSRSWEEIESRDLYKNNGRVRQEQHYISIGPFASISMTSWQSKPFSTELIDSKRIYEPGHEFHLDIIVCRNNKLIGGEPVEKINLKDIYQPNMKDYSRGHQEDARRTAINEFNQLVVNGANKGSSSLESHYLSSKIMSSVYESISLEQIIVNKI